MSKYEAVQHLENLGLRPFQIAQVVYGVKDWDLLPLSERRRLVNRVVALRHYARRRENGSYDGDGDDFMTSDVYDVEIDWRGGDRHPDTYRAPVSNGTQSVRMRKMLARDKRELYGIEYERALYYVYKSTLSRYDGEDRVLWHQVKVVHQYLFPRVWEEFRVSVNFYKDHIPVFVASYIYSVFFLALHYTPAFLTVRPEILKLLRSMVRRNWDRFNTYVGEILRIGAPLITRH